MVQFCLKLFYWHSKSKHKCLGLYMARMEMHCNLKNWAEHFKFTVLFLGKLTKILIMTYSLFANSLDIFLLVFYKHFVSEHFFVSFKSYRGSYNLKRLTSLKVKDLQLHEYMAMLSDTFRRNINIKGYRGIGNLKRLTGLKVRTCT